MIIGVDAGMLGVTDNRLKVGVYWVAVNLLRELGKVDRQNTYRLYSFDPIDAELLKSFGPHMENLVLRPTKGWFMLRLPLELAFHPVDVFLALGQSVPLTRARSIGFVYDLGFFQHPQLYPKSADKLGVMTNNLMQRSDQIVTISQAVKKDIVDEYHVAEDSVTVAYPGVDDTFVPKGDVYKADRPYFLYVGSLKRGKNIPALISAFAAFEKKKEMDLYLVGSDFWLDPAIDASIAATGISGRVKRLGYVPDDQLAALYRGAAAFVSPSRVEGFCLPAAEAMRCGCPVIVSDIPTFVEVVGNAGIRVDLENPDALVQALEDVLSKSIRATLVKKGLVQSKNFRWHAMAETIRSLL